MALNELIAVIFLLLFPTFHSFFFFLFVFVLFSYCTARYSFVSVCVHLDHVFFFILLKLFS